MKILIYGAGVIGSLYAVLFAEAGYDTSVYARGKRLEFLKKNGLLYKKKQDLIKAEIKILGEVSNDGIYDFVLLTVREKQGKKSTVIGENYEKRRIQKIVNQRVYKSSRKI